MIQIGKTTIQPDEGSTRLSAGVSINGGEPRTLWFSLPQHSSAAFASDRADCFVMALLPLAMREGHSIVCDTPVSDRLQYQLNQCLIPAVMREMGVQPEGFVQVTAPLFLPGIPSREGRPAALKFSKPDGLSAALEVHDRQSLYPLTHLAVWNLAGHDRADFQEACREAADLAREHGLETLCMDTNLGDEFGNATAADSLYWELACALALDSLGLYLFCTSRPAAEFKIAPQDGETYALLAAACSCTETLRVHPFGPEAQAVGTPREQLEPLVIGQPYLEDKGDCRRLCAQVELGKGPQVMWISVAAEYADHLTGDRCDAFVAALLPKAMREGREMVCRGPVSRQLLYQVNQYLIPILAANIEGYHRITVRAEAAPALPTMGKVFSGGTGGADCMYTIFESQKVPEGSRCKLTHLFLASNGAIERGTLSDTMELMADRARRKIVPGTGLDVLTIDSNLQELLPEEIFIQTVDYRHAAVLLALQKYLGTGLIAASYGFFELCFAESNGSLFEFLVLNFLSTETTVLYSSGGAFSRKDKLHAIKDFPIAQRALHPCIDETAETNCGKCLKCTKTEGLLYAMGKLDDFSAVFDTAAFVRKRHWFFAQMIFEIGRDPHHAGHYIEVIDSLKEAGKNLWPSYVLAYGYLAAAKVYHSLRHMLRWCKRQVADKPQK